jgi:hypothetical protein
MYTKTLDRLLNTQHARLKTNDDRDVDPISFFYELDTAVVIRVVDSLTDPEVIRTNNTSMLGAIQCKPFHSSVGQGDDSVIWAFPFDANIRQYPVKDELVVVGQYGASDRPYYRVLGTYNSPNFNGNSVFNSRDGVGSGGRSDSHDSFLPNSTQLNILPKSGDTILQSRYGSAVRFTNSSSGLGDGYAPSILISNDIRGDVTVGNVRARVENVNRDGSSIYLTSGTDDVEYVPNLFFDGTRNTVINGSAFERSSVRGESTSSFSYPSALDGNQIIISSDRLILGSRINETLIFSKGQVGVFTDSKFSVDSKAGVDISTPNSSVRTTSRATYINSNNIFLGGEEDRSQPSMLGSNTVLYLNDVVRTIQELTDVLVIAFKSAEEGGQLVIPGVVEILSRLSTNVQTYLKIGEPLKRQLLSDKVFIGTNVGSN